MNQPEPQLSVSLTLRVFLPFAAGYYISYVFRSINALLGPQIALEFDLGASDLGFFSSLFFLIYAIAQMPFGILLDRYGPRRVNAGLLVVAAIGALIYALATSLSGLAIGRTLVGLGVSVTLMSSFQAFVLWYPQQRIATVNSRAFAVGILGAITVTVPLEAALRIADWRVVTGIFAGFTLLVSLAIFFVVPDRRRDQRQSSLYSEYQILRLVISDRAFQCTAALAATSQGVVTALTTLWIATWLRDVFGYDRAATGRALLFVYVALIAGFLIFGRLADWRTQRGQSYIGIVAGGVGLSSVCIALIAFGITEALMGLWIAFTFFGTAATLGYSILSRRFPTHLAGRVNTALNTFVFAGMFLCQWLVGVVLAHWPQTSGGYSPEAYAWAFGGLWLIQLAGLAWFWSGREIFDQGA
jgi:predicted MFS family arabinose efflux permease